jgi:hypothetical protein
VSVPRFRARPDRDRRAVRAKEAPSMACDLCTKQVSVFLENKGARMADVCDLLGRFQVNIRAFATADTADFGILRLIVNDPTLAVKTLRDHGYAVSETDVLVVPMSDRPGGLASVLLVLRDARVDIEYMYAFVTPLEGQAVVILRVADQAVAQTIEALGKAEMPIVEPDRVYGM